MARFGLEGWFVMQARVTAFSVDALPQPERRNWWTTVVEREPDARVVKIRASVVEEGGPFEGNGIAGTAQLTLNSSNSRVDWRMLPREIAPNPIPDNIGTLPSAANL